MVIPPRGLWEVPVKQNRSDYKESLSVADSYLFTRVFLFHETEKAHSASKMDVLNLMGSGKLQHISLSLGIDADIRSFGMDQVGNQQQECGFFD
jgi:hypothetical protein